MQRLCRCLSRAGWAPGDAPVPKRRDLKTEDVVSVDQPFTRKTLAVTGKLERFGRQEIESLIEKLGGKTVGSVSKKTDYLIAGEKAGSKLEKARKLGVAVLSEQAFLELIGRA